MAFFARRIPTNLVARPVLYRVVPARPWSNQHDHHPNNPSRNSVNVSKSSSPAQQQQQQQQQPRRRQNSLFDPWFPDVFDEVFGDPLFGWSSDYPSQRFNKLSNTGNAGRSGLWAPKVDISETDKEVILHFELPGLKKENINLELKDRVLTVSGERTQEFKEEDKEKKFQRVERTYGKFSRSFGLPENVEVEKVEAKYVNGVLDVRFPKTQAAEEPESIKIKITE